MATTHRLGSQGNCAAKGGRRRPPCHTVPVAALQHSSGASFRHNDSRKPLAQLWTGAAPRQQGCWSQQTCSAHLASSNSTALLPARSVQVAAERCLSHLCASTSGRVSTPPLPPERPAVTDGTVIYSRPELYELAFSYRDIKQEVKYLRDVYKKLAGGSQPLATVVDLGSGPGLHAHGLAAAGVSRVIGVDINPVMLDYARGKKAKTKDGVAAPGSVTFVQGDMRQLQSVLDPGLSADMVTCLLGTLTHMLTTEDIVSVFTQVAGVLRPGGLFVIELAHPGDLFDGTLITEGGKEMWEVAVPASKGQASGKLLVEWGSELDDFNPVTQVIERTVCMNQLAGEDVIQSVEEVVPARQFTVQEIRLLARIAGLEVAQLYGDMSASIGLSHEEAYRLVAVLKKPLSSA